MGNKNWLCVNWEDSFNQKKKKKHFIHVTIVT